MKALESPYKILFSIGIFYSLLGSLCWTGFRWGWMPYPITLHAEWMMLGFLLSMASGFLLTAIPKFLNALPCQFWELGFAVLFSMLPLLGFWLPVTTIAIFGIVQLLWLLVFGLRRILKREFSPPATFIFLPLGVLGAIVGCWFMSFNPLSSARVLLFEGMMLAFIFGIGAKLITALLGWSKPIQIDLGRSDFLSKKEHFFLSLEVCLFIGGQVFHGTGFTQLGDFCWALVGLNCSCRFWHIHRIPRSIGSLPLILWMSSISILMGLWLVVIFPEQRLHLMHFIYISGMSMMTLMIATRVILSHGGYSLEFEMKSRSLLCVAVLILLAAATRIFAPYLGSDRYINHLAYAGIIFGSGIMIWVFGVLRKAFAAGEGH